MSNSLRRRELYPAVVCTTSLWAVGPRPAAVGAACEEEEELDEFVLVACGLEEASARPQLCHTGGEVLVRAHVRMPTCVKTNWVFVPPQPLFLNCSSEAQRSASWYLNLHHATSKGEVGSFEVLATWQVPFLFFFHFSVPHPLSLSSLVQSCLLIITNQATD